MKFIKNSAMPLICILMIGLLPIYPPIQIMGEDTKSHTFPRLITREEILVKLAEMFYSDHIISIVPEIHDLPFVDAAEIKPENLPAI